MIVYMIMDQKTGRWWHRGPDPGWTDKQESGSVYTQESHANLSMKQIAKRSKQSQPVKLRFALHAYREDEKCDTYHCEGGEIWWHDTESDTWMYGDNHNGCGVYHYGGGLWNAHVIVEDDITILYRFGYRDKAMQEAIQLFREKTNET